MRLRAAGYVAAFLDGVVVTMETRYAGWATALAHLSVNHPRSAGCTQLASVPSLIDLGLLQIACFTYTSQVSGGGVLAAACLSVCLFVFLQDN